MIDECAIRPQVLLGFRSQLISSSRYALTTMMAALGTMPIPIARMGALGFLVEIGYPELCWSAQEAAELVTRMVGAPVDAEDLQHIVSDTQGWVAGIAIASDLYRQEKERNARAIVRPTGLRHE